MFDLDGAGYINAAELGDAMEALGIEATTQVSIKMLYAAHCGLLDGGWLASERWQGLGGCD